MGKLEHTSEHDTGPAMGMLTDRGHGSLSSYTQCWRRLQTGLHLCGLGTEERAGNCISCL